MAIGELQHEVLGKVLVTVRQNSRHVSARWKSGMVNINVPQGIRIPELKRILDDLTPRLIATRPQVTYHDGQELLFPHIDFVIRRQNFAPARILGTASVPVSYVEVGSDWNFDLDTTSRAISDMLCKIARKVAPQVLIPVARDIADRLGCHPTGWSISTGHRTLGQCAADGIISLSYVLVFLPSDLCEYVICHELAHLSEMNHGEQFHQLLDTYLDGRERELRQRMHAYMWPVLRK